MPWNGAGPSVVAIALGILLAMGGCGSADTSGQRRPILLVIESEEARDGFVRSDGFLRVSGNGPGAGDLDATRLGLGLRMFYSFPLREIPADAIITSVTLRVFHEGTLGQPFANLGDLIVDHVDPGDSLAPEDYAGNTLEEDIGSLSFGFAQRYWSLGVDEFVARDQAAGRARSWFRLRFTRDSNLDGDDDVLMLNDGENSRRSNNLPLLEVIYTRP